MTLFPKTKNPFPRTLSLKEATMTQSKNLFVVVVAIVATALFLNPNLVHAECPEERVIELSKSDSGSAFSEFDKLDDDECDLKKALIPNMLIINANEGCEFSQFAIDLGSDTDCPDLARLAQSLMAKATKPEAKPDDKKVADKPEAKPDDSKRMPAHSLATCYERSSDLMMAMKAVMYEDRNKNYVPKTVKDNKLHGTKRQDFGKFWERFYNGNYQAFAEFVKLGDPKELKAAITAHMIQYYTRGTEDPEGAWNDPSGRAKALVEAALAIYHSYPEENRDGKADLMCGELAELEDTLTMEMTACACFHAQPASRIAFETADDERNHRTRITKWADLQKDMPVEVVRADGAFFGRVSDKSDSQAVVHVGDADERPVAMRDFAENKAKVYAGVLTASADSQCKADTDCNCPSSSDTASCNEGTCYCTPPAPASGEMLSMRKYHVGGPATITAFITSDGKPLLPEWVDVYGYIAWSTYKNSSSQNLGGIIADVDIEGQTWGGGIGMDLKYVITSYFAIFGGFYAEMAHRENLVYDPRGNGRKMDTSLILQLGGRVGGNFADWFSLYVQVYGQPVGGHGWGAVVGVELTGISFASLALEGGKHFSLDSSPTAFAGGEAINPDGPIFRMILKFHF